VLNVPPTEATHPADAARLLQLAQELITDDERGAEVWQWAEGIATLHPQDATVLNLLAVLGDTLRDQSEDLEELIPADRIAHLFKTSLDLDPFHVRNHARAGAYHLHADNLGEAERCLARGFRLDRSNNFLALRLARVYRMTERPRDALAVLDMALREDADDPEVAWDAGLTAFNLEQWDAALMYFDVYEGMEPDRPWANYYRAISLLELERPNDALEAIAEEERRSRDRPWPTTVLRACAHAVLGDLDGLRQRIKTVLATPLVEVDYLTVRGVSSLSERLWKASTKLPLEDPLRGDLNERLLRAGVMPDDYFDWFRMRGEKQEDVNYYRCVVLQPLDENWKTWPGCLSGQEDWNAYFILWGVLALDEEEAEERVLKWQAKCYPLPAKVVKVELQHEGYTDKPGVVWQGERWEAELDEADEE
jgi:tetratricopeptide (TPR) repeat protein